MLTLNISSSSNKQPKLQMNALKDPTPHEHDISCKILYK